MGVNSKNMRIYQINIVCGFGSTGRIVVDLANSIEEEGGNCRIAYGRKEPALGVDSYKFTNQLEVYSHVFMTRIADYDLASLYAKNRKFDETLQGKR